MTTSSESSCVQPRGFFAPHLFVVATPTVISARCRRPAVTLLLSTNGRPFRVRLGDDATIETGALLVRPGQDRSLHAEGCDLVSINVEPGHPRYIYLRKKLGDMPALIFGQRHSHGLSTEMRQAFGGTQGHRARAEAIDVLLDAAAGAGCPGSAIDNRIAEVLERVHTMLPEKVPLPALAKSVGLSEDRLSHLFVNTVGTPLRSYIVWQRYKLALGRISQMAGLSALAQDCGFSDAAHMTRTFVVFFGMPPSLVARSGFIQDFSAQRVE